MTSLDIGELFARLWAKEKIKAATAEEIHDRNFQWLKDITDEAKSLFKKESIKVHDIQEEKSENVNSQDNETDLNDSVSSAILPVLLPKTPREKNARASRIKKRASSSRRPSFSIRASGRNSSRAAQSRIRSNLTQNLNRKMRRPTDINESKSNGSQQTSSINTEDSTNSEDEPEKQSNENFSDSASGDIANISANKSSLIKIQDRSQDAQAKRKIEEKTEVDHKETKNEMVNPNVEKTSEKEKSLETNMICSEPVESDVVDHKTINTYHCITENTSTENSQEIVQTHIASPPKIRVLRSQSSVVTSETEDEGPVRRSARNKKKLNDSPVAIENNKKFKGATVSPVKASVVPNLKPNVTPSTMGTKSISLASLRHPNQKKNTLYSAVKDGKNCSTSALIAAAKASSSKANNTRRFTPQSPLKDTSTVNAALGIIGSGGQYYHTSSGSSGSSTLSKFRSRIGNAKSPIKSASKNIGNIANIRSFLPQKPAKVAKPTAEEVRARKEEELNLKKLKADEAMRKKDEAARAKQEERRLQNEARQKRVQEARQAKEQQRIHERERTEKEAKERQEAITRARQQAEERRRHEQEEKRKADIEHEKIRAEEEKERKRQEEIERRRLIQIEEERKKRELEYQKRQQAEAEQRKQEALRMENTKKTEQINGGYGHKNNDPNETYEVDHRRSSSPATPSFACPNSTYTKKITPENKGNSTVCTYDITPARHELPPEELKDQNNYDINDLRSDEDTDDEDNPRKVIPGWANGDRLKQALIKQAYQPPNLDLIFSVQEATPDLAVIFSEVRKRFHKRTSSAVWDKPPESHLLRRFQHA